MTSSPEHARLLRLATRASVGVASVLIVTQGDRLVAQWLGEHARRVDRLTARWRHLTCSICWRCITPCARPMTITVMGMARPSRWPGWRRRCFIAGSAVLIALQAFERIKHPEPVGAPWLSIGVIILSLALTVALLFLQHHVVRETGSSAVRADSLHYRSDLLLNGSILIALVLAGFGFHQIDAWFGLGIAAYILWSAIQIARESFAVLMDEELPPDVSQHMLELARGVPGVLGAHDLRTRISGNHWFVQLHLELPGELTLSVAHGISDQAADAIHAAYPRAEVLVHADPLDVVSGVQA